MRQPQLETKLISMLRANDACRISLFGSYARGEQTAASDLDVLVAFSQCKSLFALVRLQRELSEQLGVTVDLITEQALSPVLLPKIADDLRVIYQ